VKVKIYGFSPFLFSEFVYSPVSGGKKLKRRAKKVINRSKTREEILEDFHVH